MLVRPTFEHALKMRNILVLCFCCTKRCSEKEYLVPSNINTIYILLDTHLYTFLRKTLKFLSVCQCLDLELSGHSKCRSKKKKKNYSHNNIFSTRIFSCRGTQYIFNMTGFPKCVHSVSLL